MKHLEAIVLSSLCALVGAASAHGQTHHTFTVTEFMGALNEPRGGIGRAYVDGYVTALVNFTAMDGHPSICASGDSTTLDIVEDRLKGSLEQELHDYPADADLYFSFSVQVALEKLYPCKKVKGGEKGGAK
jgi:hypothetical protein